MFRVAVRAEFANALSYINAYVVVCMNPTLPFRSIDKAIVRC